jgi:hypothetical protein
MMINTNLSPANYDNLLIGWSTKALASDVVFEINAQYTINALSALTILNNQFNWQFIDEGQVPQLPAVQGPTIVTTANTIVLSWTPPAENYGYPIQQYKIYRGTSSGIYDRIFLSSITEFNDTEVEGGITYYYIIIAVNEAGAGVYSTELSITTDPSPVETTPTVTVTDTLTVTDTITESEISVSTVYSTTTATTTVGDTRTNSSQTNNSPLSLILFLPLLVIPIIIHKSKRNN